MAGTVAAMLQAKIEEIGRGHARRMVVVRDQTQPACRKAQLKLNPLLHRAGAGRRAGNRHIGFRRESRRPAGDMVCRR